VSRLDYCRNIQVDHNIVDYLALLKNCSFGGRVGTSWQTETVTFFNKSQELCLYNKILEVKQDARQSAAAGVRSDTPENVLRIESRMKAADVVRRSIHRRTFSECFDFDVARSKLLSEFDKLIHDTGRQLELNFNDDLLRLRELKDTVRYSWREFITCKGMPLFLMQYNNDLELIKKLLLSAYSRRHAYDILRDIKDFMSENRTQQERHLLDELKLKLAA